MKTDDLIAALAADSAPRSTAKPLALALVVGGLMAMIVFGLTLGVRPDLRQALVTWRFDFKLALLAIAVTVAITECLRLSRPTARPRLSPGAVLLLGLLGSAVAIELALSARTEWSQRLIGSNALVCLAVIPALAVAPLISILWALRSGAPASPTTTGAAAGLLAGAIAALLYATHCFDDSPLFVATWYPLAISMMGLIGALVGRRILTW